MHVKKCRPQVCPHAAFLTQLQSWYFALNKENTEGITESVHNIDMLSVDENELQLGPALQCEDS